jgi:hypothetical protein
MTVSGAIVVEDMPALRPGMPPESACRPIRRVNASGHATRRVSMSPDSACHCVRGYHPTHATSHTGGHKNKMRFAGRIQVSCDKG